MDRAEFIAMLPRSTRREAIERAIGNGSSAALSHNTLMYDHHLGHIAIRKALPLLVELGLIEIGRGPHNVNVICFSNRWRTIDAGAAQMTILARGKSLKADRRGAQGKDASP